MIMSENRDLIFSPVRIIPKPSTTDVKTFFAELPCYCPPEETRRTARGSYPCDACLSRRYMSAFQADALEGQE